MKYIEEIFDKIELEKFQRDGDCIYDPIRCFFVSCDTGGVCSSKNNCILATGIRYTC